MRLLLDTHTLLWALDDHPRLGQRARELFLTPQEQMLVSIASAWEMAIKQSLGKLQLSLPIERMIVERLAPGTRSTGCSRPRRWRRGSPS